MAFAKRLHADPVDVCGHSGESVLELAGLGGCELQPNLTDPCLNEGAAIIDGAFCCDLLVAHTDCI